LQVEDRKKDGGIRTKLELEKRGEKTGIEPEAAARRTATPSSARECAPKEGLEAKSELSRAKITNGSGDFLKKTLHESSEVKMRSTTDFFQGRRTRSKYRPGSVSKP
jgi:hypothetical protein